MHDQALDTSRKRADITLPGVTTRHQIEFTTETWTIVTGLLGWLEQIEANIVTMRSTRSNGLICVVMTVDHVTADQLFSYFDAQQHIRSRRIEHLLMAKG